MMNMRELKEWSKNKAKTDMWKLLGMILVSSILTSLTIGSKYSDGEFSNGINIGFFLYFVEVGLYSALVNFVNGGQIEFKDIFKFSSDFSRILITRIFEMIYVFLWTLLLIVPGIIKSFGYSLVPFLLADSKYNDLSYREILQKSEEMMNGHKMDYFILGLSFIGWHILAIFTFGILEIWILPYQYVAQTKFLDDIKTSCESKNISAENISVSTVQVQ